MLLVGGLCCKLEIWYICSNIYVSENLAARLGIYRGFDQIPLTHIRAKLLLFWQKLHLGYIRGFECITALEHGVSYWSVLKEYHFRMAGPLDINQLQW